jgi:hypothetical protein
VRSEYTANFPNAALRSSVGPIMSLVYRSEPSGGGGKTSNIYLGGKLDAKDLASIRAKGITHILNVTPPKEAGVKVGPM